LAIYQVALFETDSGRDLAIVATIQLVSKPSVAVELSQWSCRNDSEQIPKAIMTQAKEQRKQNFWGAMYVSSAGALGSEHYVQNSV
jgi:hypothetical protein